MNRTDNLLHALINRYKSRRSRQWLADVYSGSYAFVGIGNHSIMNLYPVLQYLQVPVKYICCTSADKLSLIENKYHGTRATTSLDQILDDREVCGVFVSASPRSHRSISSKVLARGKSLFVEKPICHTLEELCGLEDLAATYGAKVAMVGMQKRYAPASRLLSDGLRRCVPISYNYRYTTGLYPEGDVLAELFIHPLDYVMFLFGEADVVSCRCIRSDDGGVTYLLLLQHEKVAGVLELSSAYTWADAQETLTVNTRKGTYTLHQMEGLKFQPRPAAFCGIPIEKVLPRGNAETRLYERNNFIPSLVNNQIYSQGYYSEIKAFVDANEREGSVSSAICDLFPTYRLMEKLRSGGLCG